MSNKLNLTVRIQIGKKYWDLETCRQSQKKAFRRHHCDYYFIFIDKFYKFTMEFRKKVAVGRQGTHQVLSMYVDGDPFAMVYQNKTSLSFTDYSARCVNKYCNIH